MATTFKIQMQVQNNFVKNSTFKRMQRKKRLLTVIL